MTIYGKIVDGVLETTGDLPASAAVLSTNRIVHDLAGTGAQWMEACGWYDLSTVDPMAITTDGAKQADLAAAITAATTTEDGLVEFIDTVQSAIAALLNNNWDFLDAYTDRLFPGQQDGGEQWPQYPNTANPTTLAQAVPWVLGLVGVLANRIEILRTQLCFVSFAQTREGNLLRLLSVVEQNAITRDPSLTAPTDGG